MHQKEYATIDAIMAYWNLTTFRIKVDHFQWFKLYFYGENNRVKKNPTSLTELGGSVFSLHSCMSGLCFMNGELDKEIPKFNAG